MPAIGASRFAWGTIAILATVAIAVASYLYGVHTAESRQLAYVQAGLAFAHYKSYGEIESLLLQKCDEAALTVARGHKTGQLKLLSDNFRATHNDPGLAEYIKFRDPELLATISSGRVPEFKTFTYACP
jgi:hypothetical protein